MAGKIALQCDSCNWKFKRGIMPKLCPNCGKASVTEDKRKGAEEILKELDELSNQFNR